MFAPIAFTELLCLRFTEDRGYHRRRAFFLAREHRLALRGVCWGPRKMWRAADPYRLRLGHLKTPCWRSTSPNSPTSGEFAPKTKIIWAMWLPIRQNRRAATAGCLPLPTAWAGIRRARSHREPRSTLCWRDFVKRTAE